MCSPYCTLLAALQSAYSKIAGKQVARAPSYLNRAVIRHFNWLTDTIEASDGIHIIDAVEWGVRNADRVIHCDASLSGLGFVDLNTQIGFYATIPPDALLNTIFFYEALCVISAILWASELLHVPRRLLVFTDSLNTVEMFNSLRSTDSYTELLLFAMCILLTLTLITLCVFHIPGTDNFIADALSCQLLATAASYLLGLQVHLFQPPCSMLGLPL